MVGDLGRALQGTVPEELKDRVEEAMKESVVMATKGRRYVDHVKTHWEFGSKDSESGSYKAAAGVVPAKCRRQQRSSGRCSRRRVNRRTRQTESRV